MASMEAVLQLSWLAPIIRHQLIKTATLQKCGVNIFSVCRFQRGGEMWREILAQFSECRVCQGLDVRNGKLHKTSRQKRRGNKKDFMQISLCWGVVLTTERTKIAKRNRNDFFSQGGQIARSFRRKSVIFTRNSQNQIPIASDGHSHLLIAMSLCLSCVDNRSGSGLWWKFRNRNCKNCETSAQSGHEGGLRNPDCRLNQPPPPLQKKI